MATVSLRLAQWLPTPVPAVGDSITVAQPEPLETRFGQAAFPEAPEDGTSYGRKDKDWAAIVIPPFLPDAPVNGKFYARRNATWDNLDSFATNDAVVAYVAANSIPDAPNDGAAYLRKNKGWVASEADTFPIPIDHGGTGAINAADARTNLGGTAVGVGVFTAVDAAAGRAVLGLNGTIPWMLQDGTVGAPGLAWASEPGLGWFRPSAGQIHIAAVGQRVWGLDASTATDTNVLLNPRAAGRTAIGLINQPGSSVNFHAFNLLIRQDGVATINTGAVGSATVQPLEIVVPTLKLFATDASGGAFVLEKGAGVSARNSIFGRRLGVDRWRMDFGSDAVESGGNVGSDWRVLRFADAGAFIDVPIQINRGNGAIVIGGNSIIDMTSGRIRFPVAQIASTDPNTLDDYEEGVFTLVNGAGVAMNVTGANYVKIGRSVTWTATVNFAINASPASITLSGLPFAGAGAGTVGYPGANIANGLYCNVTGADIAVYAGGGFATFAQLSAATIYLGGTYLANA